MRAVTKESRRPPRDPEPHANFALMLVPIVNARPIAWRSVIMQFALSATRQPWKRWLPAVHPPQQGSQFCKEVARRSE